MKVLITAALILVGCAVCYGGNATITQLDSDNGTLSFMCNVCAASNSFRNSVYFLLRDTNEILGTIPFSASIGTITDNTVCGGKCQTVMLSRNLTDGGFCVTALLIGLCFCLKNFTLECQGHQHDEVDQFNYVYTENVALRLLTSNTGINIQYLYCDHAVYEKGQEYDVILARFPQQSRHGVQLRPLSIEGQELNTSDHLNTSTSANSSHLNVARIFLIETGVRDNILILLPQGRHLNLTGGSSIFNFFSSEQPTRVTVILSTLQNMASRSSSNTIGIPVDI